MKDTIKPRRIRRQDCTEISATEQGYIVIEQFGDVGEESRVVEISINSAPEFIALFQQAMGDAQAANDAREWRGREQQLARDFDEAHKANG